MSKKSAKAGPQRETARPAQPAKSPGAPVSSRPLPFHYWVAIGISALAFLLYANTLGHGYTLDDPLAIGQNDLVKQGLGGIPKLLTSHYRAGTEAADASVLLYRPLSLVAFAFEWAVAPNSPFFGHLMNVLWYALTAGLAFLTLRRLFRGYSWLWAGGAALLFAVHPLHTEVVASIKSRDEIMSLFFGLTALYGWARFLESSMPKWRAVSMVGFFLALLSKESALTLLPVFPLAGWFFFEKAARESVRTSLVLLVPAIMFLLIRAAVLGSVAGHFQVDEMDNPIVTAQGYGERAATGFMVLWKYAQLLVWPQPLLCDYSYRHLAVVGWGDWQAAAGLILFAGLAGFAFWGLWRRYSPAFCAAAFLCSVVLYSQLVIVIGTLFGERLMYLPSLWFCAGLAFAVLRGAGFELAGSAENALRFIPRKAVPGMAVLAVWALFGCFKTVTRNPDWASNLSLFTADVRKAPDNLRLCNGLSTELFNRVWNDSTLTSTLKDSLAGQARAYARAAITIHPNPVSYVNLGNEAGRVGQYADAISYYQEAEKLLPGSPLIQNKLARNYLKWGREEAKQNNNLPRAAELLEQAMAHGLNDATAWVDLGTVYGRMGNNEKAAENFERAVQLNPKNAKAWKNLATAYHAIGKEDKAEEAMRRAEGR